ncbi:MAG: membrane protein insertase YidC [bacterium]|nr:membrane protein insertase YidC [bacterium]
MTIWQTIYSIWQTLVQHPLTLGLVFFSSHIGLGGGIILITVLIKIILLPVNLLSFRHANQIAGLQGDIDKLKKKYQKHPQKLARAQAALFKEKGVVPAAGCLPAIVQLLLFLALYQILIQQVNANQFDPSFFWLDLTKPDPLFILPLLAGLSQLGSVLVAPAPQITSNTQAQKMQKQMMFFMSIFTVFIASRFPSGIALYWVVNSVLSLLQQLIMKQAAVKKVSVKNK